MNSYIYDLILLAILAVCTFVYYKMGFIKIVLGTVCIIASLILAWFFSSMFAGFSGGSVQVGTATVPTTRTILFIVFSLVFSVVLQLVLRAMQAAIDKIPVVGFADHLLGGVLGLILGLLGCYVLLNLVAIIIYFTGDSLAWMNSKMIEGTLLVKYLYQYNLLLFPFGR